MGSSGAYINKQLVNSLIAKFLAVGAAQALYVAIATLEPLGKSFENKERVRIRARSLFWWDFPIKITEAIDNKG